MINKPMKIAGVNAKVIKLADVSDQVSQDEIDSIFKHGKITNHVYQRIRNGVLVLFCSVKVGYKEIEIIVSALKQKMKDQKKRQLFDVTVFEFTH